MLGIFGLKIVVNLLFLCIIASDKHLGAPLTQMFIADLFSIHIYLYPGPRRLVRANWFKERSTLHRACEFLRLCCSVRLPRGLTHRRGTLIPAAG